MGLYFRKCLGLGPLSLNFSRSGIGISTGVRGLRAGLVVTPAKTKKGTPLWAVADDQLNGESCHLKLNEMLDWVLESARSIGRIHTSLARFLILSAANSALPSYGLRVIKWPNS
jgi:uncharacterized protein DUF4236